VDLTAALFPAVERCRMRLAASSVPLLVAGVDVS
jgi:hypothetical protein